MAWIVAGFLHRSAKMDLDGLLTSGPRRVIVSASAGSVVSSKQFLSAVAIMALGICAAWPFRRDRPAPLPPAAIAAPATNLPATDLTLHPQGLALSTGAESGPSPATNLDDYSPYGAAGLSDSPLESLTDRHPPLEALGSPPEMPTAFHAQATAYRGRKLRGRYQPRATAAPWPSAPSDWPPAEISRAPLPRTHRIVDGDTLERIAERYLGDGTRGAEIFEANRTILDDPQILPLGKVIRIPRAVEKLEPVVPPTAAERSPALGEPF
jgi:hypothetical protein